MDQSTSIDLPKNVTTSIGSPRWGSDLIVDVLRLLEIEYVTVLPGATTRGIHDSIVNYAGNSCPELVLCNHEMICASMARGYARVTGRPMAALIHDSVGLMNTSMTIYDCWYDRSPVLLLGGTGPVDSQHRRPWIDWIHTANVQGNLVRDFTKWDDQPASIAAIPESILRAYRIATTEPKGPVYVCFDVDLQEALAGTTPLPQVARYRPAKPQAPDPAALQEAAAWLVSAEFPIAFADRVGRNASAVQALVDLADLLAMPVIDTGGRMNFPTPHELEFSPMSKALLKDADVVLGLDALDLFGAMRTPADPATRRSKPINTPGQRVVTISLDELLHRGWSTDYQGLPAVDLPMLADTGVALPMLLEQCRRLLDGEDRLRVEARRRALTSQQSIMRAKQESHIREQWDHPGITEARLLGELWKVIKDEEFVFTSAPLRRMAPGVVHLSTPDQYVAGPAGGVVGAAPGVALGAALALRNKGKLAVAILGDGALLMSIQALWTAAHYRIPSVWIVNNNRSYLNDEDHQDRIAKFRSRPAENRWIGQRMEDPVVDFAAAARAFGLPAEGPIRSPADLEPALRRAVEAAKNGDLYVIDVWTENRIMG